MPWSWLAAVIAMSCTTPRSVWLPDGSLAPVAPSLPILMAVPSMRPECIALRGTTCAPEGACAMTPSRLAGPHARPASPRLAARRPATERRAMPPAPAERSSAWEHASTRAPLARWVLSRSACLRRSVSIAHRRHRVRHVVRALPGPGRCEPGYLRWRECRLHLHDGVSQVRVAMRRRQRCHRVRHVLRRLPLRPPRRRPVRGRRLRPRLQRWLPSLRQHLRQR